MTSRKHTFLIGVGRIRILDQGVGDGRGNSLKTLNHHHHHHHHHHHLSLCLSLFLSLSLNNFWTLQSHFCSFLHSRHVGMLTSASQVYLKCNLFSSGCFNFVLKIIKIHWCSWIIGEGEGEGEMVMLPSPSAITTSVSISIDPYHTVNLPILLLCCSGSHGSDTSWRYRLVPSLRTFRR